MAERPLKNHRTGLMDELVDWITMDCSISPQTLLASYTIHLCQSILPIDQTRIIAASLFEFRTLIVDLDGGP